MSTATGKLMRHPMFWQLVLTGIVIAVVAAGSQFASALLPLIAVAAWLFVLWRFLGHRLQARIAAADAVAAPSPGRPPAIVGELSEPQQRTTLDPDAVRDYLVSHVIGQDVVAEQIARGIYRRMAQEHRSKPVFTVLISGPTGTGKTEIAKRLAEAVYGTAGNMFRIDCANVIGEAGLQTLIGSPKGFAGSESWGALTAHLRATPRSLILFDEIEKAVTSPTAPMAKLLLSLLDEGICTEQSDGTAVSAKEAVILMTSNAAQDKLGAISERFRGQPEELVRATKDVLRDHFAPEFLARIDLVSTTAPLSTEAKGRIIALHAGRIAQSFGLELERVDAALINHALQLWATLEGYGTREIIRWIETAVSDELIQARSDGASRVGLTWADDRAVVERL